MLYHHASLSSPASFLFFFATPPNLFLSFPIFHLASRILASRIFTRSGSLASTRSRENFSTCAASCIASSLQRAFLRHPFPSDRIRRCRLSRSRLVERVVRFVRETSILPTAIKPASRRALLKFFRGIRARLSTTFNFRYLFGQPHPSLSEFLRFDELCSRTSTWRNNYQSSLPFPLPVKNERKEARRGKKAETIVGKRKETERLTFTLPSRTKFSAPPSTFLRFCPGIPADFLATSPSSRYPFTQRSRRQRFFVSHYHPSSSLLIPHSCSCFFPRIVDWLKIGTLNEVSKSLSARTPSDYRSGIEKAGLERGRTCKISKINLFGTLANYAFLDRVSRFHPFHLDRSSRSLDSSKMKSIGKELENRRRTHATRSEEEKRKRKETGANVEMDRSWNADRISGNLIDCYSTGRVMETCQVSFV